MRWQLSNISLNMFLVLDALCRHKNTVRAAQELNISQPAVSQYIKKLKQLTGEELFIRTHAGLEPTESCMKLKDKAEMILDLCESVATNAYDEFDPKKEAKEFNVAVPLQKTGYFFDKLTLRMLKDFPLLRLNLISLDPSEALDCLEQGILDIYIGLKPDGMSKSFSIEMLTKLHFKILCSKNSPLHSKGKISKKEYLKTPHIKVSLGSHKTPLDIELEASKLLQEHLISVPDKDSARKLMQKTEYLHLMDEEDAKLVCKEHKDIKILEESGFSLPSSPIYEVWSRRNSELPAHGWLRRYIKDQIS